jgi:hypothetical protein
MHKITMSRADLEEPEHPASMDLRFRIIDLPLLRLLAIIFGADR